MNQVVIVGRIKEINKDKVKIAATRNYKGENGDYEVDIIPCYFMGAISKNANEYCEIGDVVGIRGRLENKENKIVVMTDKLTFLSAKQKENEAKE